MKTLLLILTAVGALAAGSAFSQSGADVVKTKGCLNCHEVDKKKIGPSFKDVATKYKDDKDAGGKLVDKLKAGQAHPKIAASDSELKAAVQHVLSVK